MQDRHVVSIQYRQVFIYARQTCIYLFKTDMYELSNAQGCVFCALHELEYGAKCCVCGCTNQKVDNSQACIEHQAQ